MWFWFTFHILFSTECTVVQQLSNRTMLKQTKDVNLAFSGKSHKLFKGGQKSAWWKRVKLLSVSWGQSYLCSRVSRALDNETLDVQNSAHTFRLAHLFLPVTLKLNRSIYFILLTSPCVTHRILFTHFLTLSHWISPKNKPLIGIPADPSWTVCQVQQGGRSEITAAKQNVPTSKGRWALFWGERVTAAMTVRQNPQHDGWQTDDCLWD